MALPVKDETVIGALEVKSAYARPLAVSSHKRGSSNRRFQSLFWYTCALSPLVHFFLYQNPQNVSLGSLLYLARQVLHLFPVEQCEHNKEARFLKRGLWSACCQFSVFASALLCLALTPASFCQPSHFSWVWADSGFSHWQEVWTP